MAQIEVHLKDPNNYTHDLTDDIIAAPGKAFGHLIFDGPSLTVRIRLSPDEVTAIRRKLACLDTRPPTNGG
jgi:hypothetical protein